MIVVDAMNVIGSVPDGRWKDRDDALRRLVDAVAGHELDEPVTVVTSDRGLVDRLPSGTRVEGALTFRRRVGW